MSKQYLDLLKAFELSEGEQPPEHIAKLLESIQAVVNRAYHDGYHSGIKAFSEITSHE